MLHSVLKSDFVLVQKLNVYEMQSEFLHSKGVYGREGRVQLIGLQKKGKEGRKDAFQPRVALKTT